jgi:hypothetical protein
VCNHAPGQQREGRVTSASTPIDGHHASDRARGRWGGTLDSLERSWVCGSDIGLGSESGVGCASAKTS